MSERAAALDETADRDVTTPEQALYVQTNAAGSNGIAAFTRKPDATLLPFGSFVPIPGLPPGFAPAPFYVSAPPFPTGGAGTGVLLASQGALAVSADGRYLFAVNAGSNEVSSLAITPGGLRLVSKVPSGGIEPRSLTVHGDLMYVVNGFGTGQIAGFRIGLNGVLTPLDRSVRPLSTADSSPVQIGFNNEGNLLVVSELFADRLTVFRIGADGRAVGSVTNRSAGESPYGFAFTRRGHLVVSEAFGFRPKESAVSSYSLSNTGKLTVISASVPDGQQAACWIAITPDGRYAYTSNTASGTISGYRIDARGKLTLLDSDGQTGITGDTSFPVDMVITRDGRYLYALNQAKETIATFRIESDGRLSPLPAVGNLPSLAVGLAIR